MAASRGIASKDTDDAPQPKARNAAPGDLLAAARALLEEHDEPRPERVEAALWGIRHAQSALKEYGDAGS